MQGIIGLSIAFLLALAPAAMFFGLWRGLQRMQRGPLVRQAAEWADVDDPAVSMSDAADAVFNPNKSILGDNERTQRVRAAGECGVCGERNEDAFDYCRACNSRL